MCLHVKEDDIVKIAEEDIVCYKRMTKVNRYVDLDKVKDGDSFVGRICGIECEGKVSVHESKVHFCTNNCELSGDVVFNKHGYEYSWIFDYDVETVTVNGVDVITINLNGLKTPYRGFIVKIGETYTSDLVKGFDEVNRGLHSFANLKDAKSDGGGVYVKCIIPKGSQYYVGKFGDAVSYASDKLTYVEVVE